MKAKGRMSMEKKTRMKRLLRAYYDALEKKTGMKRPKNIAALGEQLRVLRAYVDSLDGEMGEELWVLTAFYGPPSGKELPENLDDLEQPERARLLGEYYGRPSNGDAVQDAMHELEELGELWRAGASSRSDSELDEG